MTGSRARPGDRPRKRVVIVGGGTAGWMTAAALVRLVGHAAEVHLVESEEIGVVGVGEATLPHLRTFIRLLGIDERVFMAVTDATYKLGIEFRDFGRLGDSYLHPFGDFGRPVAGVPFHHFWLRMQAQGRTDSLFSYSPCNAMAAANRFAPPDPNPASPFSAISYAYQFDAMRFAPFLRGYAEARGCRRTEGRVTSVDRDAITGDLAALKLASGEEVAGDLFVDCSGFRSLLVGTAMGEPWEDWSRWLPCDRAVAAPSAKPDAPTPPFTRATASAAGWCWRIPLRHRTGNGHVYSSAHMSDDAAAEHLLALLDGEPLAQPRLLRFSAGRRRRSWVGNVVAVGLASGFLEPLESTSIYLVQAAILQLIELFPYDRIEQADRDEFNRMTDLEYDRIRDFLILHYHATERQDSAFWNDMRTMQVPDTLASKLALWRDAARIERYSQGLFFDASWIAVSLGQNVRPRRWDARADVPDADEVASAMDRLRGLIDTTVAGLPSHDAVLGHVPA